MIFHKESLYMKIVCAVIGGFFLSSVSCIDKECDVKEIEALFLEHPDEHIKSALNGSRSIIEATTIKVQCKSTGVLSWVYCKDGKWIYQDVTCPLNQTNTIHVHDGLERNVKRKRKRFFGLLLYGLICLFSRCSRPAPRDNVKPHIRNCPPDFFEEAIPFQYYTFVNWTEPTAWDNKDGTITATPNGKRSGAPFFEGQTNVGYFAKDSSGNMGTCNFVVHVKVIRCQRLSGMIENGYRVCHLGSDMVKGTVCRYGCYQGHSLKGQSKLECLANGQWSFKKEPYCEKKKCKAIRAKDQLSFSCTEEYYFRSICTYKCSQGYEIPDTVRRTKVCLATGIWNGKDPYCEDTQPPTIDHCPTTLIFYLKENESSTYINWNIPTVSDNRDNRLKAKQVSGPTRSTKQDVNTYTISYEANDYAGNNAKICSFVVVVKQLRCRRMYALPYMDLNCTGTKLGSSCSFSCEDNSVLNGTHTTFCRKVDKLPMSKWDMKKQPFCQVLETCPDPDAPFNGALACDVWLGGRLCHPSCAKGYSVLVTKRLPSLIVCLVDGRWLHRDKITSCLARENSVRQLAEMSAEYYFNGDCNDLTVQNQIKQKFIQIIQRSPSWKSKCNDKCDIQNVQVICGATERKRSTGNLFIKMDLNFESGSNKSLTSEEYESEVVIVTDVLHILKEEFASNITTALNRNSELIYLSMTSQSLEVKCPDNTVPVYDVIVGCVACPVGTFYDPKPKTCIECPRGTYQPHVAKNACFPCPNAQTTARSRAITKDECEDACAPGTWSSTGLPPCFDCDIGFYETSYGSISCTKCPGNRITIIEKSENISNCYDFDIVFPKDNGSPTVILDVSNVTLSIPYMISLHVKSEMSHGSILKLVSTGNTVIEIGVSNTFIQGHKKQHSKELDLKKRWYHMLLKMDSNSSSLFVDGDECVSFSSINTNYVANVTITLGGDGFAGVISQLNFKNGLSASITKKEKCFNNNDARGPITWFDFAYSAMEQSYIDIPSRCDDNDDCAENPCIHGNCTDNLNSYSCFCEKGFSGLNCEVNIDDCARNGCQNNATCQDGVHDYLCICPYGYTGELCEVAMVDGEWSKWDSWAECSVSCGNGTRQRRRSCSDPLPDNGGKYCEGVNIETETCHREICRECSELVPTNHSTLSCTNSSNMIICTQKCDEGYWFDQDERYDYRCGNETFYLWDFQTKDNPYARLPYCTEVIESPVINVEYSAFYNISICSSDIEELMLARINSVFSSLKCYEDGICNSEMLQLMNCEGKRKRRDLTFKNVGYSTTLSCNTTFFGTAECYTRLEKAVDEVNNLKNSNLFNIQHDVDTYSILINSSRSDAGLECPVGSVPVIAYCVPCSIGHFFANDECVSCPVGTYQHFTGQTFCYICQKGKTTEGKDSVSEYDCNITVIETNEKPWYVIGVVSSIPVLVICVVVAIIYSRKQRKKIPDKKSSQRGIDKVGKAKLNITMLLEHKGGQVQMNKERYGERVNKTFVDDFQQETYN